MSRFIPWAGLGLLAVVAALLQLVWAKTAEERDLRDVIGAHEACADAMTARDLTAVAERCPPELAAVHAQALRSEVCDSALLSAEVFVIRSACSTEVKTLLAQRDAETGRADNLVEILNRERADRAAAITRAESRARTEAERTARAAAALAAAPRDGAGHVVLDAERLRQLADQPAHAAAD